MKRCIKCNETKQLTEFHRKKQTLDGLQCYCKTCAAVISAKYYATDKARAVKAKYHATEAGKVAQRKAAANQRKLCPEKIAARNAVNNAITAGRLIKPDTCSKCGATDCRIEGHHPSYAPEYHFDVEWLCKPCHVAKHWIEGVEASE